MHIAPALSEPCKMECTLLLIDPESIVCMMTKIVFNMSAAKGQKIGSTVQLELSPKICQRIEDCEKK